MSKIPNMVRPNPHYDAAPCTTLEREALEALVAYRQADKACNAYHDGSPFPGSEPPFTNDGLLKLAGVVKQAVDKVIASRALADSISTEGEK